ncbi:hypothetical protein P3L10_019210 [Capsicum annuum]
MDAQKQYYRIHGMPLDMQVWLYECCSVVHPKIIVEYASRIPRLLNWETTDKHAHFEVFIEAILADVDNPVTMTLLLHYYIRIELFTYAVDDTTSDDVSLDDDFQDAPPAIEKTKQRKKLILHPPPHKKQKQVKSIKKVVTQKTVPRRTLPKQPPILKKRKFVLKPTVKAKPSNVPTDFLLDSFVKKVKAEIGDLRKLITKHFMGVMKAIKSIKIAEKDPNVEAAANIPIVPQSSPQDINAARFSGHNVEVVEDIPVVSQSSSQHIGTDRSSTPKQGDTCSVKLNSPSYFIVDPDDDIQFNKVPKKKEILEENSHQIHTSDEQVIKDDGVATLGPEIESQYEIPDELLPSLNLMKSIIIHPTRCIKDDTTPVPMQRNRKLSRWNLSPFTTKFGSSSGTSASASCDSPILNKKHPFTPFIGCPYDLSIENKYLKWIKEGLLTTHERKKDNEDRFRKHKSNMPVPLQFGVELVSDKNWFHKLSSIAKFTHHEFTTQSTKT